MKIKLGNSKLKSSELSEDNHITSLIYTDTLGKFILDNFKIGIARDLTSLNGSHLSIYFKLDDWKHDFVNDDGEPLDVVIFENGLWMPYIEYMSMKDALISTPKPKDITIGYIEGTHHHLGTVAQGMVTSSIHRGYELWMELSY